ncbi:hypothetical protein HYY75_11180 [bacterium]|nr:hypothetical protein [bacterium]
MAFEPGKITLYDGNYSQFLWAREQIKLAETTSNPKALPTFSKFENENREHRRVQKGLNKQKQKYEKEILEIEGKIEETENQLRELEKFLSNPPSGLTREELTNLSLKHTQLGEELNEALGRWETLNKLL